jgi:hypothetical protein
MKFIGKSLVLFLALHASLLLAQGPLARSLQGERQGGFQAESQQLFALANKSRAAEGYGLLKWDPALAAAARRHCLRMAAEGPIAHQYAGEPDVTERAAQAGAHFSLLEENVAAGPDPATIHEGWMHSPKHRANLLNPQVNRVGIAVVASRGVLYAVADYERAVPVLTQSQVEAAVGAQVRARGVAVLRDATLARAACAMDSGMPRSISDPQPRFVMRWQGASLTTLPQVLIDRLASGRYHQASVGSCLAPRQGEVFTTYRLAVLLY